MLISQPCLHTVFLDAIVFSKKRVLFIYAFWERVTYFEYNCDLLSDSVFRFCCLMLVSISCYKLCVFKSEKYDNDFSMFFIKLIWMCRSNFTALLGPSLSRSSFIASFRSLVRCRWMVFCASYLLLYSEWQVVSHWFLAIFICTVTSYREELYFIFLSELGTSLCSGKSNVGLYRPDSNFTIPNWRVVTSPSLFIPHWPSREYISR